MRSLTNTIKVGYESVEGEGPRIWELISPDRNSLTKLKRLSLRNRSWFTKLSWRQRRLVDAVIIALDRVRSPLLLRLLAPIIGNLLMAIGGDVVKGALALMGVGAYRMMRNVVERIIQTAKSWGNKIAHTWLDGNFIKYLIIMSLPQNRNGPLFSVNGNFSR